MAMRRGRLAETWVAVPIQPLVLTSGNGHRNTGAPSFFGSGQVPVHYRWQLWHDEWRHTNRDLRWYGRCISCRRNVWAFDDGENDPRGVLGDHALWTVAVDWTMRSGREVETEVRCCAFCANDYDQYQRVLRIARQEPWRLVPLVWPHELESSDV